MLLSLLLASPIVLRLKQAGVRHIKLDQLRITQKLGSVSLLLLNRCCFLYRSFLASIIISCKHAYFISIICRATSVEYMRLNGKRMGKWLAHCVKINQIILISACVQVCHTSTVHVLPCIAENFGEGLNLGN